MAACQLDGRFLDWLALNLCPEPASLLKNHTFLRFLDGNVLFCM